MPRRCTVCSHAERAAIDEAIAGGAACNALAPVYGLSADALLRHSRGHVPRALSRAAAAREETAERQLLSAVLDHHQRADRLVTEAEALLKGAKRRRSHGDAVEAVRAAAMAMREARGTLDLLTKAAIAMRDSIPLHEVRGVILGVVHRFSMALKAASVGENYAFAERFARFLSEDMEEGIRKAGWPIVVSYADTIDDE